MKLLVLTYRLPWHSYTADRYTMLHFVQHFSQRHQITLAAFAASEDEAKQATVLAPYCERVVPIVLPPWQAYSWVLRGVFSSKPLSVWLYYSPRMQRAVRELVATEDFDAAYVYHLRMGQYLAQQNILPRCIALQPAQVLNLRRFKEHARHPIWKLAYTIEHQRMSRYEPAIARNYDRALLISERDREAMDPGKQLDNVFFNPHGVDPDYFCPDRTVAKEPQSIVFHASMRYQANSDAILYFVEQIYPRIKQRTPGAKLYVVGFQPPPAVQELARDPSIVVTGFVEDVRTYLNRAQVAIDPLRIGAGLQNKVLESLATGLPVVATPLANEGIGASPGEHILLSEDPAQFADQVLRLFEDPALREQMGAAAREFIEQNWSWEAHYAPLERLLEQLVVERRGAGASTR